MNQISGGSSVVEHPLFQTEGDGAIPISPLQLFLIPISSRKAHKVYSQFHYLGEQPCIATAHYGVYFETDLLGCISIGVPNAKDCLPFYRSNTQAGWWEIKRFALSPACPKNSESRVISVALKLFRKEQHVKGVITYADSGVGHVGTIYKASGFEYVRMTAKKADYILDNRKTLQRGPVANQGGQWVERSRKHLFVKRFIKEV